MLHFLLITAVISAVYLYYNNYRTKFSRQGVKYVPPNSPVKILTSLFIKKKRTQYGAQEMDKKYYEFKDERFYGQFDLTSSIVVVKDIELIKKITVKDFEHFLDHRTIIEEDTDPLFGRNLFSLKGHEWKDMRSTLSPAFTSSKIRLMVPFMAQAVQQMMDSLKDKIKQSQAGFLEVNVKDMTTRLATDVIASCAFGIKVNSHRDLNNEFYEHIKASVTFDKNQALKMMGFGSFPKIMKLLRLTLFSEKIRNFFSTIVLCSMSEREEKMIHRPDMIHLLMEAKKGKLSHDKTKEKDADAGFATVEESAVGTKHVNREWSDNDLVAQAILFLIAGYETISTAMSFLLHELAFNPDVQQKLYQEIRDNEQRNDGQFDYNSIQSMKYLDMVVSELLRLWPPLILLDRICVKDYNIGKPNDNAKQDFILRKGDVLTMPVWCIHHDADHFPDPMKFDPERFSDENKHKIKPFTYIPFGSGPRNCIGSRFALCEIKVMVYQFLKEMEVSPSAKTQMPVKLVTETFNIRMEGGHWVNMIPRA